MRKLKALGLTVGICLAPYLAAAAPYDGSMPLLCAPIEITECVATGSCLRATAEGANIPQFFKIDFAKKMISATQDSSKNAPIKNLERGDGKMIMHGGQGGRGWTMVISEETGKMSATVSEDQFGFIIFGACTPL